MPSEYVQAHRPELAGHRSNSSTLSHTVTDSPSTTPPQHKIKGHKHVVGRTHARVPSSKGLHKLTKAHGNEGSHTDLKKLNRNSSSATSLKNNSHVSLKRNRSSVDVTRRPKSSQGHQKRPQSVHFEIGDQDEADGGWEEASSSASPALSRSASRLSSHHSSTKPSAENSVPQSPEHSPTSKPAPVADGAHEHQRPAVDAKVITERLLQRTPSHNTTKMSLTTATPTVRGPGAVSQSPEEMGKSQSSTLNGTPKTGSSKEEMSSRFVGSSGTPSDNSPFLSNNSKSEQPKRTADEVRKSRSMGNLSRRDEDEDSESALAPRARKTSTTHAYNPPQQSRTQQKLWLQRASSNIEPQQMAPGSGLNGIHSSLVGASYDGRDPRIRIQLERTGLEYLVVRRHQDPVGKALRRLGQLPGAERNRQILGGSPKKSDSGSGPFGLSQSMRERRGKARHRGSYDGGSLDERDGAGEEDEGVGSLLRSIWEKNFDLSASAD